MQQQQARQLREQWGDKPCAHSALDRLYFGGAHDGYVCIRCGKEFTAQEKDRRQSNQQTEQRP